MRRFIAYLSLAVAGLATIGATFNSAFVDTKTNIEYADGKSLVFRISPEEGQDAVKKDASKEIAKMMESRLQTYGETKYDIVTQGDDTVKVTLSESQESHYSEIQTYLSFNGAFALGTSTNVVAVGDEFLKPGQESYVTYLQNFPTVVIPIDKETEEFKAVIEEAERLKKEAGDKKEGENPEDQESGDKKTYIYLAYNWDVTKDNISEIIEENKEEFDKEKYEKKYMLRFDIESLWLDDNHDAIATTVNIANQETGQIDKDKIADGTHIAHHTVNLLNSEKLPYDVEFLYSTPAPAYFENVISLGMRQTAAVSRTLVATLFAILILTLLLAVFYRWGAVAISVLSVASVYIGLLMMIAFAVEFNTAAILGLCAVGLASLASGIVYLTKVKEESYRGRTLKKANAEGSKRALLPIIDINVVLIIIGACVYWLGGTFMASFASVAVFGGIASLILNTLGLKGLMWLLTNTTKFQGNYTVIGVENNKVPNILNDEKQEYFGPYQNSKPTKHRKSVGIVAGVLLLASLIGTVTFGSLKFGQPTTGDVDTIEIFNDPSLTEKNACLYFETEKDVAHSFKIEAQDLLERSEIAIEEEGKDTVYKNLDFSIKEYEKVETIKKNKDDVNPIVIKTTIVVATLDGKLTGEETIYVYDTLEAKNNHANPIEKDALNKVFEAKLNDFDSEAVISFKTGKIVSSAQPVYTQIVLATLVGTIFATLYLLLRYGIAHGLTALLAVLSSGMITAGVFSLTRVAVGLDLFIALPVVTIFTFLLAIIFMNKEKELIRDESIKNKDTSVEHHKDVMLKTASLSLGPTLTLAAMGIYLMTNFFGFGAAGTSNIFMFGLIGVIFAIILIAILYGPISHNLYALLNKFNIDMKKPDFKKKKKNKKKVVKAKSAEPEEAIFIGIND